MKINRSDRKIFSLLMKMPSRKIILFDDEDILSICSYIMEGDGWQVHSFTECIDVVERVKTIMPSVILMDNWIPEMGGIVATRSLKNGILTKQIPVFYFSANSDIQKLAEQAGNDFYLVKPFDVNDLQNAVSSFH